MPLSSGPTLLAASGPMLWQGAHLRNELSPAATSWANAAPVDTTSPTATNTNCLILTSPCAGYERPQWRSWALLFGSRAPKDGSNGALDGRCQRRIQQGGFGRDGIELIPAEFSR